MSGMIERGAAAMAAKRRELIAHPLDRIWPDLMRAAIEAMRNPTEAMESAFNRQSAERFNWPMMWAAAVDAALKPSQPASEVQP